jgi:mono/diheme cytochrome c family protein
MRRRGRGSALGFALAAGGTLAALFAAGCGESQNEGTTDVERGRRAYLVNCTACHNTDPALPGAIGPAVAGSKRELIEARVMRAEYPPGYTPKQSTHAMVALPQLAGSIDDLAAYLASVPPR